MSDPLPGVPGPDSFPKREDDGFFGPQSLTWKLYADPSGQIGMIAAVFLQALNPNMMRLFDKVSANGADPEGRAARTGQFILTTTFGDKAHSQKAAATVRRLHSVAKWTDPRTGEVLEADNPDWLLWTHSTLVWGVLRASDFYGPSLTPQEQDRFVVEQHASAELIGIDTSGIARTRGELDAYIDEQSSWMALTAPAADAAASMRKPSLRGNPLKVVPNVILQDGIVALLPGWAFKLYGIEGRPMNLKLAKRGTRLMLAAGRKAKPYQEVLRGMLADADAHPYKLTRKRA